MGIYVGHTSYWGHVNVIFCICFRSVCTFMSIFFFIVTFCGRQTSNLIEFNCKTSLWSHLIVFKLTETIVILLLYLHLFLLLINYQDWVRFPLAIMKNLTWNIILWADVQVRGKVHVRVLVNLTYYNNCQDAIIILQLNEHNRAQIYMLNGYRRDRST